MPEEQENEVQGQDQERKQGESRLELLIEKASQVAAGLEKASIAEYMQYVNNPRRVILMNFLAGLSRGFGIAVGFTLLGAMFIYALSSVVSWNLPVIGQYIADIVKIVMQRLRFEGGI